MFSHNFYECKNFEFDKKRKKKFRNQSSSPHRYRLTFRNSGILPRRNITIINPVLISSTTPCFNETPINDLLRIESARMPCNERLDERYIQSFHTLTITLSIKFSYRYSPPPPPLKSFRRPYSIFSSSSSSSSPPPSPPSSFFSTLPRGGKNVSIHGLVVDDELVPRGPVIYGP